MHWKHAKTPYLMDQLKHSGQKHIDQPHTSETVGVTTHDNHLYLGLVNRSYLLCLCRFYVMSVILKDRIVAIMLS